MIHPMMRSFLTPCARGLTFWDWVIKGGIIAGVFVLTYLLHWAATGRLTFSFFGN